MSRQKRITTRFILHFHQCITCEDIASKSVEENIQVYVVKRLEKQVEESSGYELRHNDPI